MSRVRFVVPYVVGGLTLASLPWLLGCFCGGDSFESYATDRGAVTLDAGVPASVSIRVSAPPAEASADPVLVTVAIRDCTVGAISASARLLDSSGASIGEHIGLIGAGTARFDSSATIECPDEYVGFFVPTSLLVCAGETCTLDATLEVTSVESEGDREVEVTVARERGGSCRRARSGASVTVL